ncbi:PREDICTED: protein mesh-like [Wasmannia auropunctata]|uniref:protein mesh-like n=1 Tax=Wasmannia auropunctata TaxID=64793 RepID=UPI0005EDCEF4|nr:PREDICTED: protein mesh-like [Wasmannia auropunctata]
MARHETPRSFYRWQARNVNHFHSDLNFRLLFFYTFVRYNVHTTCFVMHTAGQQEYSSRQAGITTGIVLACLIPIVLIVICVGYRVLKSRCSKENREHEERTRQAELQRLRKIGEDEESIPYSPSKATEIN